MVEDPATGKAEKTPRLTGDFQPEGFLHRRRQRRETRKSRNRKSVKKARHRQKQRTKQELINDDNTKSKEENENGELHTPSRQQQRENERK